MHINFLGGVGTVTGSKTLVTHKSRQVLVDCGLFQGYKNLRLMNWESFPFDPKKLAAVVLTHAHLDHSGALPLLVKQGFKGPVFATPGTIDACAILLPDSGHLQEEDANYLNRHAISKHQPALPLYTKEDALRSLRRLEPLPMGESIEGVGGLRLRMQAAGHIVGAASVELHDGKTALMFSGDLGRFDDPIMRAPKPIGKVDHLVLESTYGDREHGQEDALAVLADVIKRTAARGGVVVIPAFALGRAQEMLYAIFRLKASKAIPNLPVYLNSPMAIDATAIYRRHRAEHRLTVEECKGMCQVARMTRTVEESQALNQLRHPAVIISASGMATGGRVLHHLKAYAPDRRNAIVFAGFQAGGTRGARMLAGEPSVRIHGQDIAVQAEVVSLPGMSAHADAAQIMRWLRTATHAPSRVYLNHGEPGACDALRLRVERELGWPVTVPRQGQSFDLAA